MQYLHQSTYGHAGGVHTAKPILAMDKGHIFDIKNGRVDHAKPIYRVEDGRVFATEHHPGGATQHAILEIRGDKVHTTPYHAQHDPNAHVFEIHGMMT